MRAGSLYRVSEDPRSLIAYGLGPRAGQVCRLEKFENLHCGERGAWVCFPDGHTA